MRVTLLAMWLIVSRALWFVAWSVLRLPLAPWLLVRWYLKNAEDNFTGAEDNFTGDMIVFIASAICLTTDLCWLIGTHSEFKNLPPGWLCVVLTVAVAQMLTARSIDSVTRKVSKTWHSAKVEAEERIQLEQSEQETLLRASSPDTANLVRPA